MSPFGGAGRGPSGAPRLPSAIVLAAGRGERMGRDKALLPIGSHTLVEEHVQAFRQAGVNDIAVVRRAGAHDLPRRVGDVRVVLQPRQDATMFDSLVLGLFALERAPVLVLPVDNDLIGDDTLAMLVERAREDSATHALTPRFGGHRGHPVVLYRAGINAVVRDAGDPEGVHRLDLLLDRWTGGVATIDVTDDAVVRDFDTPEDFAGRA